MAGRGGGGGGVPRRKQGSGADGSQVAAPRQRSSWGCANRNIGPAVIGRTYRGGRQGFVGRAHGRPARSRPALLDRRGGRDALVLDETQQLHLRGREESGHGAPSHGRALWTARAPRRSARCEGSPRTRLNLTPVPGPASLSSVGSSPWGVQLRGRQRHSVSRESPRAEERAEEQEGAAGRTMYLRSLPLGSS